MVIDVSNQAWQIQFSRELRIVVSDLLGVSVVRDDHGGDPGGVLLVVPGHPGDEGERADLVPVMCAAPRVARGGRAITQIQVCARVERHDADDRLQLDRDLRLDAR